MTFAAREAAEADSDWAVWVSVRSWSSSLEVKKGKQYSEHRRCSE
jgi:hypothetical protein